MALISRSEIVRIHLEYLTEIVAKNEPRPRDAVYASIALRCIFEHGLLGRVGKELGVNLVVQTPKLGNFRCDQAMIFVCGGYNLGSTQVMPYYAYREGGAKRMRHSQIDEPEEGWPTEHALEELKPKKFLRSPSMGLLGQFYDRETVFRFVAHKCGGAHYEDTVDDFRPIERALVALGEMGAIGDSGLSAVFSETIGTAWFLVHSQSVKCLLRRLAATPSTNVIPFRPRGSN